MKYTTIGIDPGFTTGMSLLNADGTLQAVREIKDDPLEIAKRLLEIKASREDGIRVVIEDFIGSGRRSRGAIYTLKLIGWLTHFCNWQGIHGALHPPQRRKSSLKKARQMSMQKSLLSTPHTRDATAHAIAYWELLK